MLEKLKPLKPFLVGVAVGLGLSFFIKFIIPVVIITALVAGGLYAAGMIKK